MAISRRWSRSPVTRPDQSPSMVARPSSSSPSSAKNEMALSSDSTTMPTLSIRLTVIDAQPFRTAGARADGPPGERPSSHHRASPDGPCTVVPLRGRDRTARTLLFLIPADVRPRALRSEYRLGERSDRYDQQNVYVLHRGHRRGVRLCHRPLG